MAVGWPLSRPNARVYRELKQAMWAEGARRVIGQEAARLRGEGVKRAALRSQFARSRAEIARRIASFSV